MEYNEALSKTFSFPSFIKDGNSAQALDGPKRMKILFKKLNVDYNKLCFVHIAGTNGKGSTAAFCASAIKESGKKVGLFVSPYIEDFRERIQVDGFMISKTEYAEIFSMVYKACLNLKEEGIEFCQFDIITAVGIIYFLKSKCDTVILEAGLGGLLDSTNFISNPKVCVFTSISLDHTQILGETHKEIAIQKAGILKPGCICVCCPCQNKDAEDVLKDSAKKIKAKFLKPKYADKVLSCNEYGSEFILDGVDYKISLVGKHQIENAILAIACLEALGIRTHHIKNGLSKATIPARMEKLCEKPLIFVDGAHNIGGMKALSAFIEKFDKKPVIGVICMMEDKEVSRSLQQLTGIFDQIIVTSIDNPRALKPESMLKEIEKIGIKGTLKKDSKEALCLAKKLAGKSGLVVAFGSLYLASEIRKIILD